MRSLAILGSFLPTRVYLTWKEKVLGVVLLLVSLVITWLVLSVQAAVAP